MDLKTILDWVGILNRELAFQTINIETKSGRARTGLRRNFAFQNQEKQKRADELAIANKRTAFSKWGEEKRAANCLGQQRAGREGGMAFKNLGESKKGRRNWARATKSLLAKIGESKKERTKLTIANRELSFQIARKQKGRKKLTVANNDTYQCIQNSEKQIRRRVDHSKQRTFLSNKETKKAKELTTAYNGT